MARPARMEYPGAFYHVINRDNYQEDFFLTDKDRFSSTFPDKRSQRHFRRKQLTINLRIHKLTHKLGKAEILSAPHLSATYICCSSIMLLYQ
jgi:hypothetical protein